MEDPENCLCCDSGAEGASWASISHGIYLSIGAAGLHRSLGVRVSFVQSTTMDSWRPQHLKMMQLGGNRRFQDFLLEQGVPTDMPTRQKYRTRAAKWYREHLKALAEEMPLPAPLPEGTGHLPAEEGWSVEEKVLDQVFAKAPIKECMTAGGVLHRQPRPKSLKAHKGSIWDTFSRFSKSAPAEVGRTRSLPSGSTRSMPRSLSLDDVAKP